MWKPALLFTLYSRVMEGSRWEGGYWVVEIGEWEMAGASSRKQEVAGSGRVKGFGERQCMDGGVGRIRGGDVMEELLNLTDRRGKYGA